MNTVTWFEVATDDPDGAERFYGQLFGWTYARDPDVPMDYRMATYPGADNPAGGVLNTKGDLPNHAIFCVQVEAVEATCAQTEALGGKVLHKVVGDGTGTDFAYLNDPAGNLFGIFTPRP